MTMIDSCGTVHCFHEPVSSQIEFDSMRNIYIEMYVVLKEDHV